MLREFFRNQRGNLIEVVISMVILGALSYGFWMSWNSTMASTGENMKNKIESDDWLE